MKPAEEMRAWHVNSSMPENQSPGEFVLFSVFGFFKKTNTWNSLPNDSEWIGWD